MTYENAAMSRVSSERESAQMHIVACMRAFTWNSFKRIYLKLICSSSNKSTVSIAPMHSTIRN